MKCKKCSGEMATRTAHTKGCTPSIAPQNVEAPVVPSAVPPEVLEFMKQQTETIKALQEKLATREAPVQEYVRPERLSQSELNTQYFDVVKKRGQQIRALQQEADRLEKLLPTDQWEPEMDIRRSQIQEELSQLDTEQRKQSFIPPRDEVQVPDSFRDLIEQTIGNIEYIAMENDPVNGIFALYFVPSLDPSVRVIRAYHSEGTAKIKEGLEKVRRYLLTINNNKLPTFQKTSNIELPRMEVSNVSISKKTSDVDSEKSWIGSDSL